VYGPACTKRPANTVGGSRRLDIQGLRAVAVLAVVAFHAGLPVPGGFVGVDVFFVISGFVITSMLQREWEATGRIRFRAFYIRRFKRLTPALALVVVSTAIVSALVLSPLGAQQTVAESGIGAMALVANWVIAGNTGGYFDAPAATNPLLHTWTLSVEEQFYLAFPAILALGWLLTRKLRRRKHTASVIVGLVAAVSFCLALLGATGIEQSWLLGFYSPLTRAWEFAVGALLALSAARVTVESRKVTLGLCLVGAGMLAASLSLTTGSSPFPSLLPVLAAALVILGGTHTSNVVTRALATRPMVTIGDWSYSVYLWHWPFIVFAVLLWPAAPYAGVIAAGLSFVPALGSYVFVERPIRSLQDLSTRRFALLVATVVAAPMMVAGATGSVASRFWTPRYESGDMPIANRGDIGQAAMFRYMRASSYPCTPKGIRETSLKWDGVVRCRQSRPGADPALALIGDSHAEQLFIGFADALSRENVVYYIVNGAPVTTDAHFARIVKYVAASGSIKTVVVNAYWYSRGVHGRQLLRTLETLSRAGKAIFVTDDVPFFSFDPFECKYRQALFLPTDCARDARQFQRERSRYYPELLATVQRVPRAHMLNTAHYFCGKATCDMARNGQLLYRDDNHLNINGSRFLARQVLDDYPSFVAAIKPTTGGRETATN
jgi:peptidoglycan/LPS O-acetylase OafA/YrhL